MRFLIADDHALVRKGLIQILREEFHASEFSEVSNGTELLKEVRRKKWDIIVLDISMQGQNGIDILKQIRSDGIKTPVLIISMYPEELYALRVLNAGASGFVNKESANEELLAAVHKVLSGYKYFSSSLGEKLAKIIAEGGEEPVNTFLSDRELQVLQLIAGGKSVKEIAHQLSLSPATVATYRARILGKLMLKSNVELTQYALRNNLIN